MRHDNRALTTTIRELLKENGELQSRLAQSGVRPTPEASPPEKESVHSA